MSDQPERIWASSDWRRIDQGKWWDINPGGDAEEYVRADRIEALTEQLAAAQQDAKAAEDELEMQEQEACMMENDYIKLEKERDALEAKLAKAVEALERAKASIENGGGGGVVDVVWLDGPCPETLCDFIDATLAEIKGENHE